MALVLTLRISFEEEILVPVVGPETTNVVLWRCIPAGTWLSSGSSDDELGLPPTFSGEEKRSTVDLAAETSGSGAEGFGEMLGFENEIPSYDSFEFGLMVTRLAIVITVATMTAEILWR
ncbi:hypothetical protein GH714_018134 [Hevea brasiliensis]|uniref:Uncharacterized protein n=1 Tax=Hevea brasiliensis TaxID=3981 RepID=A0A6A6NI35_HEVBR|nr:hypothetical protein GH714_018134 [Hevea brasiliensis]